MKKVTVSKACAAAGVLLMLASGVLPEAWHPAVLLFLGLALVAIAHVLTPCKDQITQWWRKRISKLNPHA